MDLEQAFMKNRALSLKTLSEVISIPSVQENPAESPEGEKFPFGQDVQDVFMYMLSKGQEFGFETENADNYGGHIEFGHGKEIVGILGHLDVVPVQAEDWDFDPFSGEQKDGYILGRGTTDDKGPLLAAFFAMKILKDVGYVPDRRIRLILGLDEETNWNGMDYYLKKIGAPDFGFTPDADFPVIRAEKGILHFDIVKKLSDRNEPGLDVRRMSAGTARNAVPGSSECVLLSENPEVYEEVRKTAEEVSEKRSAKVVLRRTGKSLKLMISGRTSHAAMPEKGTNSISVLFEILGKLPLANASLADFIRFYNESIGYETDGKSIGCALSDSISGDLTFCAGMLGYDRKSVTVSIDIRYPVTKSDDEVFSGMRPVLDQNGLGTVMVSHQAPIYQPDDSPLVDALMKIYQEETGDAGSEPLVIGGGTYARACTNIVAFGGLFPGDPDIMHQANEKIEVRRYLEMIKIYVKAIRLLGSAEFKMEA
ncbi:MAG: dipeptidase PepV [Eubacteriales bacterium]|nr:dipeptidase PepV [Eubacteriales bacterium]